MARKGSLGIVVVGQTPREDLIYDVREALGPEVEIKMCGALDDFSLAEIRRIAPRPGEQALIVKLADGSTMVVGKKQIFPRMQKCIDRLVDGGVELTLVACSEGFREFTSSKPVVEPLKLLRSVALSLASKGTLGVIVPIREQVQGAPKKWSGDRLDLHVEVASPWKETEISKAIEGLKKADVILIVLDCYGFTETTRQMVRRETGKPVIAPRTLTAKCLKELLK